jgi:predicted MPP superfamily phosphohydrolase
MRLALETLRGAPCPASAISFHRLGVMKYAVAGGPALAFALAAWALGVPWLAPLAAVVFYAAEAPTVFLFPVALDGSTRPFRDASQLTRRAGGVVAVMRVVVPIACVMVFGGFAGLGFLRSWCLGCLAVCLWYESLRQTPAPCPASPPRRRRAFPLQFGSFGPLLVRRESVHLGLDRPLRVLYASDLHLGRWWTRPVPDQLVRAAREASPDLILLGGDLADNRSALPLLQACVRALAEVAPVHAVAGNHDVRAGLEDVRAAVLSAGGRWLPDRSLDHPMRIDGMLDTSPCDRPRLLCGHHPGVFVAAVQASYRVVLAGHLHGGQCVLATRRGRQYPAAWVYRWHGLRFADGGSVMLVSRGAGDTFPFRFNCPREVILCAIT